MEDIENSTDQNEQVKKEVPQLLTLLKEMKDGLDTVTKKVQSLTLMVKDNQYPTADGISYLEAKHLLLLSYCQSIVYYLLRKAKGFSIEGHPVVRSLVEIRLFLEKIRPIDKKMEYQIQKLTKVGGYSEEKTSEDKKPSDSTQISENLLIYRPNPDLIIPGPTNASQGDGVYRPPKFAPTSLEDDKMSKLEKRVKRKELHQVRQVKQNPYLTDIMNDYEGKPEEVRETVGTESRDVLRYRQNVEERSRAEENLFTRAPLTKMEKKKAKHLQKSRNGLRALTDFYDDVKALPLYEEGDDNPMSFGNASGGKKKFNKRKRH